MRQVFLVLLFGMVQVLSAQADVFLANRPVPESGMVSLADLKDFFPSSELARCSIDQQTGEIRVDGALLRQRLEQGNPPKVPVLSLAQALGYEKRVNRELGVTDYVSSRVKVKSRPKRSGGAKYRVAKERMRKLVEYHEAVTEHPLQERYQTVAQRLAEACDAPTVDWKFVILETSKVNSVSTGLGWVAVTEGLLDLEPSEEVLAGIIAHELAHGCDVRSGQRNFARTKVSREAQNVQTLERELSSAESSLRSDQQKLWRAESRLDVERAEKAVSRAESKVRRLKNDLAAAKSSHRSQKRELSRVKVKRQGEAFLEQKTTHYLQKAGYSEEAFLKSLQWLLKSKASGYGERMKGYGFKHRSVRERVKRLKSEG